MDLPSFFYLKIETFLLKYLTGLCTYKYDYIFLNISQMKILRVPFYYCFYAQMFILKPVKKILEIYGEGEGMFLNFISQWTVVVIFSNPLFKQGYARFTTVYLKPLAKMLLSFFQLYIVQVFFLTLPPKFLQQTCAIPFCTGTTLKIIQFLKRNTWISYSCLIIIISKLDKMRMSNLCDITGMT